MSPDIRVVAEPALPDLEALVRDNLAKLLPQEPAPAEHAGRGADWLCLQFGGGPSVQLVAADTGDGTRALLAALAAAERLPEAGDPSVLLLSSSPPPGSAWLGRHAPVTWVRTRVLEVDGVLGLLLEPPDHRGGGGEPACAGPAPGRTGGCASEVVLSDEEAAFFQHL